MSRASRLSAHLQIARGVSGLDMEEEFKEIVDKKRQPIGCLFYSSYTVTGDD